MKIYNNDFYYLWFYINKLSDVYGKQWRRSIHACVLQMQQVFLEVFPPLKHFNVHFSNFTVIFAGVVTDGCPH